MPRKSKLTKELIGNAEAMLQGNASKKDVCHALGITEETFYKWIREGEQAKRGLKAELSESVKRATALAKMNMVQKIEEHGKDSWQALAWILERRYPKEFGRRQLLAHAGADGESDLKTGEGASVVVKVVTAGAPEGEDSTPFVMKEGVDHEDEDDDTTHHGEQKPNWKADPNVQQPPEPPPQRGVATDPRSGVAGTDAPLDAPPTPEPDPREPKPVQKKIAPEPPTAPPEGQRARPTDPDA